MDVRYYLECLAKHLNPKLPPQSINRIVKRFVSNRPGALKPKYFNSAFICDTSVNEIYRGLIEKYTVQSDIQRAEDLESLFYKIKEIDFEQCMQSDETKSKILYLLHLLSIGSASFVSPRKAPIPEMQISDQYNEDALNSTVSIVDWHKILLAGDMFKIRNFNAIENESDASFEGIENTIPCKIASPKTLPEAKPTGNIIDAKPNLKYPSLNEILLQSKVELESPEFTEFSVCNQIICSYSGAGSTVEVLPSNLALNHLSKGSLKTSIDDILSQPSQFLACLRLASRSSSECDNFSEVGMACGQFVDYLTVQTSQLSKELKPVTLLNLHHKTEEIQRLIVLFGSLVAQIDFGSKDCCETKTKNLIDFALSVQTRLHAAILGWDPAGASWLMFLWLSSVRPLLRAAIQTKFSDSSLSESFSWFDWSVFEKSSIGQLDFGQISTLLSATHRYLMLLKQCREEVGDFLTQVRLYDLPSRMVSLVDSLVEHGTESTEFYCPYISTKNTALFNTDVLGCLSESWISALQQECRSTSVQLFEIWKKSGLYHWLLSIRLVFLCQSVTQFDSRYKFLKSSSPTLELLSLHLPGDVWLQFIPNDIRQIMLANCNVSDSSVDTDSLIEMYKNCESVASALDFMESSIDQCQPIVCFPISLFLCQDVLSKYVRVHSFLSAFYVSKNWLSRSLYNIDPLYSCYGKFAAVRLAPRSQRSRAHTLLSPADRLLWLLRSAVFFSLSALQQYFFTSIVSANCHRLVKELEQLESADDLEQIHNEVLDMIISGCLFPVGHRTYQASLRHLIILADMLSRQTATQKSPSEYLPQLGRHNVTSLSNISQNSEDLRPHSKQVGGETTETSWKLLATDTYQGIRFLADILSRSASKNHSVTRSSLSNSIYDWEFSSSSVAWLAAELQHASNIVSQQSKILLQRMHPK